MSRGIDYSGPGSTANRDPETGIRYGIIPLHALAQYTEEEFEAVYFIGCPQCGTEWSHEVQIGAEVRDDVKMFWNPDVKVKTRGTTCPECGKFVQEDHEVGDEPIDHKLDDGTYQARLDSSNEVWCFKSPYFTRAQFCSPCAPGACYLASPTPDGERAYCFGHDWFDGNVAPYPVYSVETGELVQPVMHLLTTGIGDRACGQDGPANADINLVTCEACLKEHAKHEAKVEAES